MKKYLKHQILNYLLFVFGIEVSAYILLYPLYMSGIVSKFEFQSSFYIAALFMPFILGWAFFFVPYVLIRKCENCGSKNMRFAISKGFVCADCDYVFKPNLQRNTKMLISSMSTPCLFFGISLLLGNILAGEEMSKDIIRFGILLSSWMPSFVVVIIYLAKFMDKSIFLNKHNMLGLTLFCTLIVILPLLMLIVYDAIIFEILRII